MKKICVFFLALAVFLLPEMVDVYKRQELSRMANYIFISKSGSLSIEFM